MTATINASTTAGVVTTADTSGILQLQTNGTAALTVDASQNVTLAGTLTTTGVTTVQAGTAALPAITTTGDTNTGIFFPAADTIAFAEGGAEAMRIDSSGNLLLGANSGGGKLSVTGTGSSGWVQNNINSGTGSTASIVFTNGNGAVGSILTSGSSTTYSTSSDYRLKEAIAPMTGALAKVALLKPCTYKWKVDGSDGQGFIAHELAEVEAGCVAGEKDAVDADGNPQYQGIDTSFLVATLTAAIQELKAIVDAQGAEIAALKGATA